jgi:hypothetical protein
MNDIQTTGKYSYRLNRNIFSSDRCTFLQCLDLHDLKKFLSHYIPGVVLQCLLMNEKHYFTIGFDHDVNIEQVAFLLDFYTNGWMKWRNGIYEYLQSPLEWIHPLIDIVGSYLEPVFESTK